VARLASTVLVVALLAATAAAFALTQGLKLQKSPISGTEVERVFSPVCACDRAGGDEATIAFRLRESDRIDVEILDGDRVVRTLERAQSYPRGPVEVEWDGRDDAGEVLPEGEYSPRVRLREAHQTITLPNPIRIDTTPPTIQDVSIEPRVLSPDGDGRADRVVVTYRLSEPGRGELYVDGERRVLQRFHRPEDRMVWNGKLDGEPQRPGIYGLHVAAFDPAGNLSETPPVPVRLRFVALGRKRITVPAGSRFAVRVSADAPRVRWRLGPRSGVAQPGTLRLRAPLQKGRYTLTVTANGRSERAAVFVQERAS
jgi:hypothetical protein